MRTVGVSILLCTALGFASPAGAHQGMHTAHDPAARERAWQKALARPPLAIGATFDAHGRLWLAQVRDGHLYVSRSDDKGASFSTPTRVNPVPERIAADGENRPKIVVVGDRVYVSWTQLLEEPFAGHVRFARSLDGGASFSAPLTVNRDRAAISHRFETLVVNGRGEIYLAWIDKRDAHAAAGRNEKYRGAAIYYTRSTDGGASFEPEQKLADHSCECCRLALAVDTDGVPVIAWRHIFGQNERDHALARLDDDPRPERLSHERWQIDACPHHGPALAVGADGAYHAAWFSGAPSRSGLFYARSHGNDRSRFTPPLAFGDEAAQAGHPEVLVRGRSVFLAWKEFDGRTTTIRLQRSADGGHRWSAPRTLAASAGPADHPRLLLDGRALYLVWYTLAEGLRLIAVEEPAP